MRRWVIRTGFVATVVLTGAVLVGCGSGDDSSQSGKSTVVGLKEFTVTPDPIELQSGTVEVKGENGGSEEHELVIVRADSADALPTDADGAVVEEEIPKGDVIGEIEKIAKGKSKSASFKLTPGTYVFFCNIGEKENGKILSHFKQGMHEVVTVS